MYHLAAKTAQGNLPGTYFYTCRICILHIDFTFDSICLIVLLHTSAWVTLCVFPPRFPFPPFNTLVPLILHQSPYLSIM